MTKAITKWKMLAKARSREKRMEAARARRANHEDEDGTITEVTMAYCHSSLSNER